MKLVVHTEPGILELNYSWLPTWLGINSALKRQLEAHLKSKLVGKDLNENSLEEAHRLVLDFICAKNPAIEGLFEYLDALKYVTVRSCPTGDPAA